MSPQKRTTTILSIMLILVICFAAGNLWYEFCYKKSTGYFIRKLESGNELERQIAAMNLSERMDEPEASEALISAVIDDKEIRHCVMALKFGKVSEKFLDNASLQKAFISDLDDPDEDYRYYAVIFLSNRPEYIKNNLEVFINALRDRSMAVQLTASDILIRMIDSSPDAIPIIKKAVTNIDTLGGRSVRFKLNMIEFPDSRLQQKLAR